MQTNYRNFVEAQERPFSRGKAESSRCWDKLSGNVSFGWHRLYRSTMKELPSLVKVASNSLKNVVAELSPTHLRATPLRRWLRGSWKLCLLISIRFLLRNLWTFWSHLCAIGAQRASRCCRCFSALSVYRTMTQTQDGAWKARSESRQCQTIENVKSTPWTSIPHSWRR